MRVGSGMRIGLSFLLILVLGSGIQLIVHGMGMGMGMGWGSGGFGSGSTTYPSFPIETDPWKPARLCSLPDGSIAAAFPGAGRVAVFSPEGHVIYELQDARRPISVSYHDDRALLVVGDEATRSVCGYHYGGPEDLRNGELGLVAGKGQGEFRKPLDIAIDALRDRMYVIDSPLPGAEVPPGEGMIRVFAIDSPTPEYPEVGAAEIFRFGPQGTESAELRFPAGMALSGELYRLFVSDAVSARISVFDLDGAWLGSFGGAGTRPGKFTRPQGIALGKDPLGNFRIYVADSYQSHVQVLDLAGNSVERIGSFGDRDGELKTPVDAGVDAFGRLLVASWASGKVERYAIEGSVAPPEDEPIPALLHPRPASVNAETARVYGGWFYTQVELNGIDPRTLSFDSLLLNSEVLPDPTYGANPGDLDRDGIPDLGIRFPLVLLAATYLGPAYLHGGVYPPGLTRSGSFQVPVEVTGRLAEGESRSFRARATIRLVIPEEALLTPPARKGHGRSKEIGQGDRK